jgi:hypothetical protein
MDTGLKYCEKPGYFDIKTLKILQIPISKNLPMIQYIIRYQTNIRVPLVFLINCPLFHTPVTVLVPPIKHPSPSGKFLTNLPIHFQFFPKASIPDPSALPFLNSPS